MKEKWLRYYSVLHITVDRPIVATFYTGAVT
jgi:hypothetical protein